MTFNDNASLDTSQVSGGSGRGGMPGGVALGGGGGIVVLLLVLLTQCLGGGGGTSADTGAGPWSFDTSNFSAAQGSGGSAASADFSHCKTGADANRYDDCRVIGTVNSLNDFWGRQVGQSWRDVTTVLYSGATNSGCGPASSEVGPFYCPADKRVYIDATFFKELQNKFGSDGGPLAKEYVVAHEYGHHISDLLGFLPRAQQDPSGPESGAVRVELQADCFAGIWAANASQTKDANGVTLLKPITEADIRSALTAAAAVGDDSIQEKIQGRVSPENFTHGTSAQRQAWFLHGFQQKDYRVCDTFAAQDLDKPGA